MTYLTVHTHQLQIRVRGAITQKEEIFEFHRPRTALIDYLVPRLPPAK